MNTKKEQSIFNMKIEKELKDRFIEICKLNDTSASMEMRKFIKKYLSDNAQLSLKLS